MKKIDLTGQRFGRLTVISEITAPRCHGTKWLCLCDCGKYTEVFSSNLRRGFTKSCKCIQRETVAEVNSTHHESKTRLFYIWTNIKARCSNPNNKAFRYYGGRGITICNEWKNDFTAFRDWAKSNGYKENLTIDRINVNGNYEPNNCRWATRKDQNRNTRANIIYKGKCLSEWAEELGISPQTIDRRIHRSKWPIGKAIFTPVRSNRITH